MRYLAALLAAFASLVLFSSPLLAQKRLTELENRMKNLDSDLEVLKEFIQEQSAALKQLREQLAKLEKTPAEIEKVDSKVKALAAATDNLNSSVSQLTKDTAAQAGEIRAIREEMARKKVNLSGQLRVRPQYINNTTNFNYLLKDDQDFFVNQRLRVGVDAAPLDWAAAKVVLQDVRGWGVSSVAPDPSDPMRVYEAFIDLRLAPKVAWLKLGRQQWSFGSERMLGANDWAQQGRSFDGADLTLAYQNYLKADLLFSILNEREPSDGTDLVFGGLYLNSPYVKGVDFDFYAFYYGDEREMAKRQIGTFGLRAAGKLPPFPDLFFDLEATLQTGTATESAPTGSVAPGQPGTIDNTHFAVAYHVELGYEASKVKGKPTIAAVFDAASGDPNASPSDPNNDSSIAFIPLFPSQQSVLGKMGLWNLSNVWDIGAQGRFSPLDGLDIELQFHYLNLVEKEGAFPLVTPVKDEKRLTAKESTLGAEIDLEVRYSFAKQFDMLVGYGIFIPAAAVKERVYQEKDEVTTSPSGQSVVQRYGYAGGDPAHWLYLQADLKF